MTDEERELINMMAEVFEKSANDCRKSATLNPDPTGSCFHATSILLDTMAADLRRKAQTGEIGL